MHMQQKGGPLHALGTACKMPQGINLYAEQVTCTASHNPVGAGTQVSHAMLDAAVSSYILAL